MAKVLVLIIGLVVVAGGAWWWMNTQSSGDNKQMMEGESMMKPTEEKMMESDTKMEDAGMMEEESDAMMEKPSMETKEGSMMKSEAMMMAKSERYVTYSKESLEQAKDSRRVLFFYASWCPNCKPADAEFREKMSEIPSDVTVVRVNYNDPDTDQEEKDLARQYGVTYQHTFVQIDQDGQAVTKWNGGKMAELLKNIK